MPGPAMIPAASRRRAAWMAGTALCGAVSAGAIGPALAQTLSGDGGQAGPRLGIIVVQGGAVSATGAGGDGGNGLPFTIFSILGGGGGGGGVTGGAGGAGADAVGGLATPGGAGGATAGANGGDGVASGLGSGSGGGGGAHGWVGALPAGTVAGGAGGAGGGSGPFTALGGGGGGGGGAGAVITSTGTTATTTATISGGAGGAGGYGGPGGGNGGTGGSGLVLLETGWTLTVDGTIRGGDGGNGGASTTTSQGGIGGAGGVALNAGTGNTLIVNGTLIGGNGGLGGSGANDGGSGAAIQGRSLAITLADGATVTGGLRGGTGSAAVAMALAGDSTLILGNAAMSGSINLLESDTVLTIRPVGDQTLTGAIIGSGGVVLDGGHVLTLGAPTAYYGTTHVTNGSTLRAGSLSAFTSRSAYTLDAGTTLDVNGYAQFVGSLAGEGRVLLGGGTLAIGGLNTSTTFAGAISGAGGITKTGTGTLTLTGTNTYTGTTSITRGTLLVGEGTGLTGTLGTGAVTIGANTALNLYRSDGLVLGNDISGTGSIGVYRGVNTLNGDGAGRNLPASYTGSVTIYPGATLLVNGDFGSAAMVVQPGATLGGSGTAGRAMVSGTLSPGGAAGDIATLTIGGILRLTGNTVLVIEIGQSSADRVVAAGEATLGGTLRLVPVGGSFTFNTPYTVLQAPSVTGSFAQVTTSGSFGAGVSPQVTTSGTAVQVTLVPQQIPPPSAGGDTTPTTDTSTTPTDTTATTPPATTPGSVAGGGPGNLVNVIGALNQAIANGQDMNAFFGVLNQPAALIGAAANQLSGEVATAPVMIGALAGAQFTTAMLDFGAGGRILPGAGESGAEDDPQPEPRFTVWGTATGQFGRIGGDTARGSAASTGSVQGIAAGLDARVAPNLILGFGIAGQGGAASLAGGLGKADSTLAQAGLYGLARLGALQLSAAGAFGLMETDTTRTVQALGQRLAGEADAKVWSGRLQARYDVVREGPLSLGPFAAVQATRVSTDSYTERAVTGGASAGLRVAGGSNDVARTELGVAMDVLGGRVAGASIRGTARLGWAHYLARDAAATVGFSSLPGTSFQVQGARPDPDAILVGAGIDAQLTPRLSLGARFEGEFARETRIAGGTLQLRYSF
ncbi:autotransporter outer membrane beta-barrel domain-containing protein [Falsiroseomonas ponticola]|uniref:autotransporter outer membrane beta-barrel domain-containing protein n=1 Tax=Falsiroseomonas ponticola TaxID=2786951 RepID=UPI0019312DCA|nr:autotransporter domain-containing protein [Roseomonas ponticola]